MFQPKQLDLNKKTSSAEKSNLYVPYQLGKFHDKSIGGECYMHHEVDYQFPLKSLKIILNIYNPREVTHH